MEISVSHGYGRNHPLSLPQLDVCHKYTISKDIEENGHEVGPSREIGEIIFENVL